MTDKKRYTNMVDFNKAAANFADITEEEFQFIEESQIFNSTKFMKEEFTYLNEDDEKLKGKMHSLTNVFKGCMPKIDLKKKEEMFREDQEKISHQNPKKFCKNHPKIQISYVCVNNECPYTFYCERDKKLHSENCSRTSMFLNPHSITKREYVQEIFTEEEFDREEKMEQIKNIVEFHRTQINKKLDIILKLSQDKLKIQSKEFKLYQFSEIVKKKLNQYEEQPSYVNLIDLANETLRIEFIKNMDHFPGVDTQINSVKEYLQKFEKDFDDNIKSLKRKMTKNLEKDKSDYMAYFENLFNKQLINKKKKGKVFENFEFESKINFKKEKSEKPEFSKNNEKKDFELVNDGENTFTEVLNEILHSENNNDYQIQDQSSFDLGFHGTMMKKKIKNSLDKTLLEVFTQDEINWIGEKVIPDEFEKIKLIYKFSTKQGFVLESFHKRTKGKYPTIMLCSTKEGRKFGAINYLPWGKECKGKTNEKNFIFSIDKKTKHQIALQKEGKFKGKRMTDEAIEYNDQMGPIFGTYDLVIASDCDKTESCSSELGNVYEFGVQNENPELYLAGKKNFQLKSLLIYFLDTGNGE